MNNSKLWCKMFHTPVFVKEFTKTVTKCAHVSITEKWILFHCTECCRDIDQKYVATYD